MDSQEQTTIPTQPATLEAILQAVTNLSGQNTDLKNQNTDLKNQITDLTNRVMNLEKIGQENFEQLDMRLLAVEVSLKDVLSRINKGISASFEALSIVESLRGELIVLRREVAYNNTEIDRLKAA